MPSAEFEPTIAVTGRPLWPSSQDYEVRTEGWRNTRETGAGMQPVVLADCVRTAYDVPQRHKYLLSFVKSPWLWTQRALLKRRWSSTRLHGVTMQKTAVSIFIFLYSYLFIVSQFKSVVASSVSVGTYQDELWQTVCRSIHTIHHDLPTSFEATWPMRYKWSH
jgi:hypothetical protein